MSNNYSSEDIARLERIMSKLDALTARQEEIINNVLAGEENIGKVRLGYLKQYFDAYSKGLDSIISRKTSELDDAFLIAENRFIDSLDELANTQSSKLKPSKSTPKAKSGSFNNSGSSGSNGNDDTAKDVENTVSNANRALMGAAKNQANFADQLAEIFQQNLEERRNALLKNSGDLKKIEEDKQNRITALYKSHTEKRTSLEQTLRELEIERYERQTGSELQTAAVTELRITKQQEAASAELEAQKALNGLITELEYFGKHADEAGDVMARSTNAKAEQAELKKFEEDRLAYIEKRKLELTRKNNKALEKEDYARILKEADSKFKLDKDNIKKLAAEQQVTDAKQALEAELTGDLSTLTAGKGSTFAQKKEAFYNLTHDSNGQFDSQKAVAASVKALEQGIKALSDFTQQLEDKIDTIASSKGIIDTRLHGSSNKKFAGSYWDQIVKDVMAVGAINPFFKQEDFSKNIQSLVGKGIAFNVEQRAFLMTIKDKIATTFDAENDALLKLIRIQQQDSTAGRLGMEAALNAFLNEMYESTEYLESVASSVRNSLYEMEALMDGAAASEIEYQVQKWMGSLYSVGMSDAAVNAISTAFGQIAAGQIEGLNGGGAGNLLIMAANDAGLPIADILTGGIDANETNQLLQAAVNYLAELADSSKDNQVVQQQLADVFGVKASDLRAATNLSSKGSISSIYGESMSYSNMLNYLHDMAGSMYSRTSIAEMMQNIWENGMYTAASGIASTPVSYLIYKLAGLLDNTVGGIDLPFVNVMGFGVDLNTTVSDLMRVAAVGTGLLGSLGPMIQGLSNSFSGSAMLNQLGITAGSGLTVTPRGDSSGGGGSVGGGGKTTSSSGYVGNSSGSDVKNSTIQESEDSKKQQMIEAKEEEESNQVDVLNTTVLKIYELLDDVASGKSSFKVQVEGYGLTKAGGSSANGGVQALSAAASGGAASSLSGGSANSVNNSNGGSVDFGGWTT